MVEILKLMTTENFMGDHSIKISLIKVNRREMIEFDEMH